MCIYICARACVCVRSSMCPRWLQVTIILTLYVKLDIFGHIPAFMIHIFRSFESLERHI